MWLVSLLSLVSALPVSVSLVVSGQDPCRLAEALPAALIRVLPGLDFGERSATPGHLALILIGRTDSVKLTLFDAEREVLSRTLPLRTDACAAAVDGAALIVERYARDLGWVPASTDLPRPSPSDPKPGVAPVAKAGTSTLSSPKEKTEGTGSRTLSATVAPERRALEPDRSGLFASLHIAAEPGIGGRSQIGLGILFFLRLRWLELGAEIAGRIPDRETIREADGFEAGDVEVLPLQVLLGAGACLDFAPSHLCAAARAGVEILNVTATGARINNAESGSTVEPIQAFELRYQLDLPLKFSLTGGIFGLLRPTRPAFEVPSAPGEVEPSAYQLSVFSLGFSLGVAVRIL